jgi:hypothetical protein
MAAGRPCRGGIDVGWVAKINDGEIYGPALYSAYQLESGAANQPRIAVGATLLNYLTSVQMLPGDDIAPATARLTAGLCSLLIGLDVDGQPIVDYLGDGYRAILTPHVRRIAAKELLPRAHQFVSAEERRYRETGNTKLALRYGAVLGYFESRLPLWTEDGWKVP